MLVPSEFAKIAVCHGTVATVSDPHEIANVMGIAGVKFMIENGDTVPFKFYFGAPSCVPATDFETSGARITANDIELLLKNDRINYLSEMMNFPGVIYDFPDVKEKLSIANKYNKPIDGHAPGLSGDNLSKYISAGITTDHECFTLDEALQKINLGMKVLIRDGSAAKNFDALHSLISSHTPMVMLCSDDLHPDNLVDGHVNLLIKKALSYGHNIFDILKTAVLNPIDHYKLDVGILRENDQADFIIIDNLIDFNVLNTFINGIEVFKEGKSQIDTVPSLLPNRFNISVINKEDISLKKLGNKIRVICAIDGELITKEEIHFSKSENDFLCSDVENDILKIVVINRYNKSEPSIGFIKNIGIQKGALATSVAHDSHNIIAVGTNDNDMLKAINLIIRAKGGMAIVNHDEEYLLPLPVCGLMSNLDALKVSKLYKELNKKAKELGSNLIAPFMTLSFMALLVIPEIKLGDKGLFNGIEFKFIDLQVE
jgi:adenine deaminase